MTDNSMENPVIIALMAKKMGKIASAEELRELERLLAENPSYAYLGEVIESLKGNKEHFEKNIPGPELADSGWQHLASQLNAEKAAGEISRPRGLLRTLRSGVWNRIAAAVALLVVGTVAVLYYRTRGSHLQGRYANKSIDVKYGRQSELLLADGTKVRLNAGSRLVYPDVFSGSSREVTLEGEAFFDVAQEAGNPFLVHAGRITIKVLGTRFDVKAYREDAELSTTLISGKIQVMMNDDPEKKIILSPHEKLTVVNPVTSLVRSRSGSSVNKMSYQVQLLPMVAHDSVLETAWLENRLVVSNETFEEVARLLERKYDVQIDFGNEALKREHLSGVFDKETIQQAMDILRMTTKFNYTIDGNRIRLAVHL